MKQNLAVPGYDTSLLFATNHFPAGETHTFIKPWDLRAIPKDKALFFTCHGNSAMDVMAIAMKYDILRTKSEAPISLVLPYLPYGRQDRYTAQGESFAFKQYAKLLLGIGFHKIYTIDAHSDVIAVLDNAYEYSITPILDQILDQYKVLPTILSPDAGATKKIYNVLAQSKHKDSLQLATATKHRDPSTGNITKVSVQDVPHHAQILIVDDICDGGRTFTEIRKLLPNPDVNLFVTHGIFSKPDVFTQFNTVFSTNSYPSQHTAANHNIIHVNFRQPRIYN